jgi:hypothetical protein
MRKILFIAFIIAASGCSKYGFVRLKYPTAPLVVLPDSIKTIAMVNRSFTKEKDKQNTIFEAVVTGEVAGSDRRASDECLRGVYERVNGWRGLTIVIPRKRVYGTGTRQVPELLDWNFVKQLCDSSKADALLVLETFDSNSDLLLSTVTNQINSVVMGTHPPPVAPQQIRMNVISLWRLYDPAQKKIIDQYQSTNNLLFDAGGSALAIPPPEALPKTAYAAGEQYIQRFLPGYYYVKRDMYKRGRGQGKQQFKTAFRRSEVADWNGAIEIWKELDKTSNRINAGRASLDIAVAYEVLGKTDLALQWAKRSYTDYGNRLGKIYADQLSYRMNVE